LPPRVLTPTQRGLTQLRVRLGDVKPRELLHHHIARLGQSVFKQLQRLLKSPVVIALDARIVGIAPPDAQNLLQKGHAFASVWKLLSA
jgi:hypothetical protein